MTRVSVGLYEKIEQRITSRIYSGLADADLAVRARDVAGAMSAINGVQRAREMLEQLRAKSEIAT